MRKNWLAATWTHRFRAAPLVPDAAFQDTTEPYPGHWRHFPESWPAEPSGAPALTAARIAALESALAGLPDLWRRIVIAHDIKGADDWRVAELFGLSQGQVRDILAHTRAVMREQLSRVRTDGAP